MFENPFRFPQLCLAPDAGGGVGEGVTPNNEPAQEPAQKPATPDAQTAEAQNPPAAQGQPAGLSAPDTERAQEEAQKNERAETPESLRERVARMQIKLGEYQLRTAAALAGVPKERIPYAMRMADVTGLDPSAPDAAAQYEAAIGKVLADLPELRGSAGGTGSTGNFARRIGEAEDPDMARIRKNILG